MNTWSRLLCSLYIASMATLVGCGGGDSSDSMDDTYGSTNSTTTQAPFETTESYAVTLTAKQQVPSFGFDMSTTATLEIDRNNNQVRGTIDVENLSNVTMGHLHYGSVGQNGAVLLVFESDGYGNLTLPATMVTESVITAIVSGETHLNIHTTDYPSGLLRGQVLPTTSAVFVVSVNNRQEVPRTTETGTGTGYLRYDTAGVLEARLIIDGISDVNAVHIHKGAVGLNDDVQIALIADPDNSSGWKVEDGYVASSELASLLANGELYFNVHTLTDPNGGIRGQIISEDMVIVTFGLSGDQEVPSVTTEASGAGYALVNTETGALTLTVVTNNLDDANMAHIHTGARGENGGVLVALEQDENNASRWRLPDDTMLDTDTLALLLSGGHYINVHSDTFPSGAIRGQITSD